jgi:hypothetical protein
MGDVDKQTTKSSGHDFACHQGQKQAKRHMQRRGDDGDDKSAGLSLTCLWLGLAAKQHDDGSVSTGFACHDGTYTMDSAVHVLQKDSKELSQASGPTGSVANAIESYMVSRIGHYARDNAYRFLGAGIPEELSDMCPGLATLLWSELDIVPIVIQKEDSFNDLDEVADSMARKCVM